MHALSSQGRLKDIGRDAAHEYQPTSVAVAMPELSVAVGSASDVGDRTLPNAADRYDDYANFRRSITEEETWSPRVCHPDDMLRESADALPSVLERRLEEQIDSELASLNRARRRLAVDDELRADSAASNTALTGTTSMFYHGQRDDGVNHPDASERCGSDQVVRGGNGVVDVNLRAWMSSSSTRDAADAAQRRLQMCGGSVLCTSSPLVTSCLQPFPTTSYAGQAAGDMISSVGRLADSRFRTGVNDDGLTSSWRGNATIGATTRTDVEKGLEQVVSSSALRPTPVKQELTSSPADSPAERSATPINGATGPLTHYERGMFAPTY